MAASQKLEQDFEHLKPLHTFNAEVRTTKRELYSKSSLINLLAQLQQHFSSPNFTCAFNIMSDPVFLQAKEFIRNN